MKTFKVIEWELILRLKHIILIGKMELQRFKLQLIRISLFDVRVKATTVS